MYIASSCLPALYTPPTYPTHPSHRPAPLPHSPVHSSHMPHTTLQPSAPSHLPHTTSQPFAPSHLPAPVSSPYSPVRLYLLTHANLSSIGDEVGLGGCSGPRLRAIMPPPPPRLPRHPAPPRLSSDSGTSNFDIDPTSGMALLFMPVYARKL